MKYPISEKELFEYRPKPFYFITTNDKEALTYDEVKKSLTELKNAGFGGIVLFNKPPKGFNPEDYLTDTWFDMVECFCIVCRELELVLWLNDGFDYPPGSIAGKLEKVDPTIKQQHINLNDKGELEVFEADWGFPAFENPKSSYYFHTMVYDEYEKRLGKYFKNPIVGFFSDADNRRVLPSTMFDVNSPMRNYFPWGVEFETKFQSTYGYDIMPYMKDVIARKDIPQAVDYWEFAGKMYQQWFANNYEWQKEHGLLYTGHTSDTTPMLYDKAPRCSTYTEGRFSDIQSNFDFPGTDHELFAQDGGRHMCVDYWYVQKQVWGHELQKTKMPEFADITHETRIKQAGSTAFMYNKKGVMCEMFAATNFGASPSDLRRIAAFQIMQGVTFIVPHAYHHRFFGPAKYFAPPDFSRHSMHDYSINMFNDELATRCCMMGKGKLVAPIALLDPTEAVWRNNYDFDKYTSAYAQLNRLPYGFAICDYKKVVNNNLGFKAVVVAGFELTAEQRAKLNELNIVIVDETELDKLKGVIPCDVEYVGEGTPHIVRKVINGEEFAFIGNIENYEPIKGKIKAYGREKEVILYPGDIYYISKNYDDIPDLPAVGTKVLTINGEVNVKFDRQNIIPLERFEANGEAVIRECDDNHIEFSFNADCELNGLKLWIPTWSLDYVTKISFNGTTLTNPQSGMVFDDKYTYFAFDVKAGKNVLAIDKNGKFDKGDRVFIEGNFDAEVKGEYSEYKCAFTEYNFSTYIPESAEVNITKRRSTLSVDKSWALQGQPFYSGLATYTVNADIKEKGTYRITLPEVNAIVDIYANDKFFTKLNHKPYTATVELSKGINTLKFVVANTYGNALEYYLEESGITNGIEIEKL